MELVYYWQLLRRRIPMIVILTTIGTALGLSIALTLPPTYDSRAVLIVESEQIPDELAASTVQTSQVEALQIIRQRILSREVLLELANRLDIYANDSEMSADRKVADLRQRIQLNTPSGTVRRRGGATDATIVTVGFSAPRAQMAADTANELVTLILQENVDMRTQVARQTLDFFTQEVERLEQDLSSVSAQILQFQEENLQSLPDSLEFRRSQQAQLQSRLNNLEREQVALQDRRAQLVILFETTGRTEFNQNRRVTSSTPRQVLRQEEVQLNELRAEYARLSAVLSENNPRMAVMRSQITAAEAAVAALPAPIVEADDGTEEVRSVEMSLFDIQLADIDAQVSYIEEQKSVVQEQLDALAETIAATPGNAVTLASLQRSYSNLQQQYNQAVSNRARAETGSIIESLSRGQRITAVEQAVAPERPTSPNRPAIATAGFAGGLGIGLLIFLILEFLNRSVRRPADLQKALGIEAFGTVPYMTTQWEHFQRRTFTLTVSAALLIGITGGLWYVDRNVRPLQPIIESVLNRINLGQLL